MIDTNEHRDTDMNPGQPNETLLRDLRSMSKISAPIDFHHHLRMKIEELELVKSLPWWKRFFRPVRDGGYPIPAFAYGAVATVVILAGSLYVYRASFVEETYRSEQAIPAEQRVPEEAKENIQQFDDQAAPTVDAPKPLIKRSVKRKSASLKSAPAPPSAAPASKHSPYEIDATESYELKLRTRGGYQYIEDPKETKRADSLRKLDSLRNTKSLGIPPNDGNPR